MNRNWIRAEVMDIHIPRSKLPRATRNRASSGGNLGL